MSEREQCPFTQRDVELMDQIGLLEHGHLGAVLFDLGDRIKATIAAWNQRPEPVGEAREAFAVLPLHWHDAIAKYTAPEPTPGTSLRDPDGYTIEGERYADSGEMPGLFESEKEARGYLHDDLKAWNEDPDRVDSPEEMEADYPIEPVWIGSPLAGDEPPFLNHREMQEEASFHCTTSSGEMERDQMAKPNGWLDQIEDMAQAGEMGMEESLTEIVVMCRKFRAILAGEGEGETNG